MLDLKAYFTRIGYDGPREASLACLQALHLAHATHIPFENLAIQLGELPIRLDLASLQEKLVGRRRGGYCFEQNTLFKAVLEAFGFDVTPCEARVRYRTDAVLPRTHMTLCVTVAGEAWLCDVGFGAQGLLQPVRMDGSAQAQFQDRYRVVEEGPLRVLQADNFGAWEDLYALRPEARPPIDFEVANWYTSTHPESRFVTTLTAQLPTPGARHLLRGTTYVVTRQDGIQSQELAVAQVPDLLRQVFGLEVSDGARFRSLG